MPTIRVTIKIEKQLKDSIIKRLTNSTIQQLTNEKIIIFRSTSR